MTNQKRTIANYKPTVYLFIPQLLKPLTVWQKDFAFQAHSKYLPQLFKQFSCSQEHSSKCLSEALFASIGLPVDAELPMATYRYQVHKNTSSDLNLVCADPVHLEVGLNDVTLTETIDDLSDDEADELVILLNSHFELDGLKFIFGSNSQWYISLPTSLESNQEIISSPPLETVVRQNITKDIAKCLPTSGSRNWQAIQNEIQMLLHSSEVNQEREMKGLPSLNSLWLWGAGRPIAKNHLTSDIQLVIGGTMDSGISGKCIAKAIKCDWRELSDDIDWIEPLSGSTMIILDQLISPAIHQQPEQYQQALTHLDGKFIKPIVDFWLLDKIDLIIDTCDGSLIKPIKSPAWKFWKKPTTLLELAQKGCSSTMSHD